MPAHGLRSGRRGISPAGSDPADTWTDRRSDDVRDAGSSGPPVVWCLAASMWIAAAALAGNDFDSEYVAAIHRDDIAGIARLYASIGDVDLATDKGKTALMLAAKYARIDLLAALIARGAEVNATNDNGGTPLMYAAIPGTVAAVELLLANGSAVDATGRNGWTALMIATAKGHSGVVALLLAHGADPDKPDIYGWTPLMRAAWDDSPVVVRALLNAPGIGVNERDDQGATALHHAASRGSVEMVRMLVEHGAIPGARDDVGRTAADRAAVMEHAAVVEMLSGDSHEP